MLIIWEGELEDTSHVAPGENNSSLDFTHQHERILFPTLMPMSAHLIKERGIKAGAEENGRVSFLCISWVLCGWILR